MVLDQLDKDVKDKADKDLLKMGQKNLIVQLKL
jgi:hypothetical protein